MSVLTQRSYAQRASRRGPRGRGRGVLPSGSAQVGKSVVGEPHLGENALPYSSSQGNLLKGISSDKISRESQEIIKTGSKNNPKQV